MAVVQRIIHRMKSRIHSASQRKSVETLLEAKYYNTVCIALNRLGGPLRIELTNMGGLDIILDEKEWVCVDRNLGDMPTFAWTDFDRSRRQSLHIPISCQLRFFLNHADLMCGTILQLVYRYLTEQLAHIHSAHQPHKILYLGM